MTVDGAEDGSRIKAALDILSGDEKLREHYIWTLKTMMTHMVPEDLSTRTLVSIVALLLPEHSRFIARRMSPAGRRPRARDLRIVQGGTSATRVARNQKSPPNLLNELVVGGCPEW
jgi:hypothetical protein